MCLSARANGVINGRREGMIDLDLNRKGTFLHVEESNFLFVSFALFLPFYGLFINIDL